jgi:hypothetical protein
VSVGKLISKASCSRNRLAGVKEGRHNALL